MKCNSIKTATLTIAALAMCAGVTAQATLVDDFSGSLSPYTETPVLYSGSSTPATTTIAFSDGSGALQATASSFNDIEQALFLRNDFTLGVGQILSATISWSLGNSQDFGIAVASTATPPAATTNPLGNTRTSLSYAFIGIRGTADHVVASGFDGATGLSTLQYQPGGTNTTTDVFISRTSATTFNVGYNPNGSGDVVLGTYTVTNSAVGTAIGFYVDMRSANSIGTLDNLTIVAAPEPSTLAMCGMSLAGLLALKRRK